MPVRRFGPHCSQATAPHARTRMHTLSICESPAPSQPSTLLQKSPATSHQYCRYTVSQPPSLPYADTSGGPAAACGPSIRELDLGDSDPTALAVALHVHSYGSLAGAPLSPCTTLDWLTATLDKYGLPPATALPFTPSPTPPAAQPTSSSPSTPDVTTAPPPPASPPPLLPTARAPPALVTVPSRIRRDPATYLASLPTVVRLLREAAARHAVQHVLCMMPLEGMLTRGSWDFAFSADTQRPLLHVLRLEEDLTLPDTRNGDPCWWVLARRC